MSVISKLALKTIDVPCSAYAHPWTKSCSAACTELFFVSITNALRINMTAYVVALIMRGRIPSKKDLKHTVLGIMQSSLFLSCHAFGYCISLCALRRLLGGFNILTASFVPSFLSSFFAILVERPSRRGLLSLYVTNVASETLFHMLVWRRWITPINYGEVVIFISSVSYLLYCYRAQCSDKDPIYSLLRFFVGPCEEQGYTKQELLIDRLVSDPELTKEACHPIGESSRSESNKNPMHNLFSSKLTEMIKYLKSLPCHTSCPHNNSCIYYCLQGFVKLFTIGYGLQLSLKLLLHMKKLVKAPSRIPSMVFNVDTLRLGAFFGGFSGIYRLVSCLLRRGLNKDSPFIAIPAGTIAGLSFCFFRDNTVALYVMWKALQISYVMGIGKGIFPEFPRASIFFHCLSTAILFHAALLEPQNLRTSYWKFLSSISGGRIADMDRKCLDNFGLESSKSLAAILNRHKSRTLIHQQSAN